MRIPLKYNLRHLRRRWRSTLGTLLGIALVVAVFVMVMALARGLRATYASTGQPDNWMVLRKGALAESSSQITVDEIRRAKNAEGIVHDANGEPLASEEMMILITLPRRSGTKAHVQVRGIGPHGLALRPQVQLVAGRMFQSGLRECIVSRSLAQRFAGCRLGQRFRTGKLDWKVVGIFDAHHTAYESEIWMAVDEAREAFHRTFYSALLVRAAPGAGSAVKAQIEADRSVHLRAVPEMEYFREQTKVGKPIQILGACLAALMSIGAAFAAMNTMYASVGARTREIGTLRVLGFRRRSIYLSFMVESLIVAAVAGVLGCLLALPLNGISTGTFNWASFAEVAFEFRVTASLLAGGMLFALGMGVLGGLLPARWAARKPVLEALQSV